MDENHIPVQRSHTAFATYVSNQIFQYKRILAKYWWILILTFALAVAVQAYMLKQSLPTFASKGRMIVNVKLSIPSANVYSEEFNNFFGTQVALMLSDTVKNRVALSLQSSHVELHPSPVAIDVTLSAKTSIFNLRAVGTDPDYVQAYLNATMDEYVKLKRDLIASASGATQSGLKEELKAVERDLEKSRDAMLNYQSSNSVVLLQPSGENSAADQLSALTKRLAACDSELKLTRALTLDQNLERMIAYQSNTSRTNDSTQQNTSADPRNGSANGTNDASANQNALPDNLGEFERDYLKAKEQIILLQARRKELSYLNTNAYEIDSLNVQLVRAESLLDIYRKESQEQLQNREHVLELQIQDLQSQIKEWEAKALDVSKKLSDYETLKENRQRLQNLYDQMQANLQTIDVNKGLGNESVTVLETAGPALPVSPEKATHLAMAGLTGLFLGIGILVLMNKLDDRPNTLVDLEHLFDLPVLAQIPRMKPASEAEGVPVLQPEDQRYPLIEAYRSLRSAFLYKDALKNPPAPPPKTIAIVGATPNDGKSMTAANLAITFAQAGARVLLIDADLRRGTLHNHFSTPTNPGLSDILTKQAEWHSTLIQTPFPNLHFIPCGTPPRHSHHVFADIGRFLSEIAGHYDYYIFDTAPVIVADDVLSLAPHLEGVIMVVRAGFTSGRVARTALQMLRQRGVKVVGLAFNNVQPNASDFYHYRYKEYYPESSPS